MACGPRRTAQVRRRILIDQRGQRLWRVNTGKEIIHQLKIRERFSLEVSGKVASQASGERIAHAPQRAVPSPVPSVTISGLTPEKTRSIDSVQVFLERPVIWEKSLRIGVSDCDEATLMVSFIFPAAESWKTAMPDQSAVRSVAKS